MTDAARPWRDVILQAEELIQAIAERFCSDPLDVTDQATLGAILVMLTAAHGSARGYAQVHGDDEYAARDLLPGPKPILLSGGALRRMRPLFENIALMHYRLSLSTALVQDAGRIH